jgi:hypothetical protein
MYIVHWLALGVFAAGCTYAYAIGAPGQRTYLTAGAATTGWGIMAIVAPSVTTLAQDGTEIGVAAPAELRLFLTGLAAFSSLVFVLYWFGLYPPEATADPTEGS